MVGMVGAFAGGGVERIPPGEGVAGRRDHRPEHRFGERRQGVGIQKSSEKLPVDEDIHTAGRRVGDHLYLRCGGLFFAAPATGTLE